MTTDNQSALSGDLPNLFASIDLMLSNVEGDDSQVIRLEFPDGDYLEFSPSRLRAALAARGAPAPALTRDVALRARVADLLHLMQFATITTPSPGEGEQAWRLANELLTMLRDDPAPLPMAAGSTQAKD